MSFLQFPRKMAAGGSLLLVMLVVLLTIAMQANAATRAVLRHDNHGSRANPIISTANSSLNNPEVQRLRKMVQDGQLAPTVNVLNTFPGTTILQFPLKPSGIKASFPNASGLVTMVQGDRTNSTSDTVTVDVQNMPPNITFTIFFIQFAAKPFGNVEYTADLTTRGDGSGETVFQLIALVAFAMDARNPGSSQDNTEGLTSGINLEHMGMWFSSLQDAQKVLNDDTLPGTIFDGGSPPLHAGPQAMTDGQTAPVF